MVYSEDDINKICRRLETLYTPAVSDSLDELGWREGVMKAGLSPIITQKAVAGPAFTIEESEADPSMPQKLADMDPAFVASILEAVFENVPRGSMMVITTNGYCGSGAFGELMGTTALYYCGSVGAVVDGPIRDIPRLLEIDFPVWARGSIPTDSVGRAQLNGVGQFINCGGVEINPGDIVFADQDGVVVIPVNNIDPAKVLKLAEERALDERRSRQEIREGRSLKEVYQKYGRL
jgi:4-hydroxy-4-methyl-2-oxoglutarate aldolase